MTAHPTLAIDGGQTGIKVRSLTDSAPFETTYPGVRTSEPLLPQLAEAVVWATKDSGQQFSTVAIGTTGLTAADDDPHLILSLASDVGVPRVLLAHDSVTSYLGAQGLGPGVVVAAGTGVVTLGVGLERMARVDGWGFIMGDAGSGFWIGRHALAAVMRAYDGRGPATALTESVVKVFPDLEQAYITLQTDSDMVRIVAGFAKVTAELAASDDVAHSICEDAGRELALSAITAARRVDLPTLSDQAICTVGGMFGSDVLRAAFVASVTAAFPACRVTEPKGAGIDGAALLVELGPEHPLSRRVSRAGSQA